MINDLPPFTPQLQDVANWILARTRQPNGSLAGTFSTLTTPTADQVQAIINQTTSLLLPRLGDVPDALADSATALLSLRAACSVESSYFMEQVETGLSPYKDLLGQYMAALKDWDEAATGSEPNAVHVASLPVGTLYPSYAYETW